MSPCQRCCWHGAAGALACPLIAAVTGFFIGADSVQENLAGTDRLLALVGSGVGACLLLVYLMGMADYLAKKAWQQVGGRVIGSWVSASSLMVLVLSFAGPAK